MTIRRRARSRAKGSVPVRAALACVAGLAAMVTGCAQAQPQLVRRPVGFEPLRQLDAATVIRLLG